MPELFLYDAIVSGSAKQFISQLEAAKGAVAVRINSGGGSVFEGLAIYNAMVRRGQITVKIDGLAASIASLIALGGSRVEMASNALMMLHNPWSDAAGDSRELRKQAELLDKAKQSMLSAYEAKTGRDKTEISSILDNETWFTADEALAYGLIDAIYEPLKIAAHYQGIERFQLPDKIKSRITTMTQQNPTPDNTSAINGAFDSETQAKLHRLAAIEAEQARQSDIRAKFALMTKRGEPLSPRFEMLMQACLEKKAITPDAAVAMIHMEMGRDMEATTGNYALHTNEDGSLTMPSASRSHIEWGNNSHHDEFIQAATDALLIKNNIRLVKPHVAARDVLGMSLSDIARTMVGQSGGTIRRGLFGMRKESGHDVLKAALTTSDFPLLLENVASKALMNGYESEPATHRAWVNSTEVPDFKMQKRVALSEAPDLDLILEGGEYKHGAMQEKGEGFALQTFGKLINLTRQAIINDDLSAFTKIPNALGRSASRLEADKVYDILMNNPAMADGYALFHANHNNLMTGSALGIDSLGKARAAMRKQKGLQGATLNIVPRFLIVPAALESLAEQLVSSLVDPSKQNATPQHAWIRGLEIVVDARLDDDNEKSWYLAADFNQVDTIEIAYLSGQRGAFISQEESFDNDSLRVKCRLDFQAAPIDWIGLIKNPGA